MEIRIEGVEAHQQTTPLLNRKPKELEEESNLIQKLITQTFKSTAHLANLLPTGSVLAFQLLSPIFTNQGHCNEASQSMTMVLIGLCAFSCFVLCFTDSFRAGDGKVCYVLATIKGAWVLDGGNSIALISPEMAAEYRIRFIDFIHGFMSVAVFAAVALFDQNAVACFYPVPSMETKEVLTKMPVGIGVVCSMLFVAFPTKRHGIGFPLSS